MYKLFIKASSLVNLNVDEVEILNKIDGILEDPSGFENRDKYQNIQKYKLQNSLVIDSEGKNVGKKIEISNPDTMEQSLSEDLSEGILIVETTDWKIIPLENLIAKYDGTEVQIMANANSPDDLELLSGILEIGVGGVIISPTTKDELSTYLELKNKTDDKINLVELEVSSIKSTGLGDRVCVDTYSMLSPGEGMLVGSTSQLFVLIEAEVHKSGYVNPRPFRVNAGVVSLYTLHGEKTNYLSELESGSEVSIINRNGTIKKERVARVKIERRPMNLLKIKYDQREYSVVLQDAETVRLMTNDTSIPINKIKSGMKILGYISKSARHFGMKVDEFVEER
ncbi:MAG: 3-dehydroquinate synthase II [Candidatus Kariarchaeaceae archaeon]|jgi:3-dehydroquinate synthase II